MKIEKNPVLQRDIMQYKKNTLASRLALLGLALGCLYFMFLYKQVYGLKSDLYAWPLMFDVVYNLFFLLFVFLFSEQVKGYNSSMFIMQIIVGVIQVARIFWLPYRDMDAGEYDMNKVEFTFEILSLAGSGACIIASAVIGFIRSKMLDMHLKGVADGSINVQAALDEEEAKEAAASKEV